MIDAASPYLTIVACSRNDGHGGHLRERMQLFIDGLADQADRFRLKWELVLVEWNPPRESAGLAEALRYPASPHIAFRVVTVPRELHERLPHAEALPLFQMIAKNVGIRRARGRMVLATNIDILFPDALAMRLAEGQLDEDALHRVDRDDIVVPYEDPQGVDLRALRAQTPIRTHRRDGTYDADGNRIVPLFTGPVDLAKYWCGEATGRHGAARIRTTNPGAGSPGLVARVAGTGRKVRRLVEVPKPHVHGAGDFTLMSRANWFRMRGHAEWPMYSWNLDGLLVYHAMAAGIPIVNHGDRYSVRHMEHGRGSGWTPEGSGDLFDRLAKRGVPVLDNDAMESELRQLGVTHLARTRFRPFNAPDWGFAAEALPEVETAPLDPIAAAPGRASRP